ncbi:MAG: urease accessory protein UreF [Rhizobiaceae bacterium]|nr:urease accessory protein UreF [Rhizobiaceae bacterium]
MDDGADTVVRANDGTSLLRLMTWLSPAFPVGAYAFSHGVEAAIAEGRVRDGEDVFRWVSTLLTEGSGRNDLILLAEAFHAERDGDPARLRDAADLCRALAGSKERREETMALGRAFAGAASPWFEGGADGPIEDGTLEGAGSDAAPYPVAVAIVAARQGIALAPTLVAYAHGFAANLVSVATRLVPLGQREAVRVLHRLEPVILRAARHAKTSSLDDLGSAAFLSDIAAMRHETLEPRLFRS